MKAPRLRAGDTIGIISPSWGGAGLFPHRTEQGVRQLGELGYRIKFGAHTLHHAGYISDSAENRAADIHTLFEDPQVGAIISAIGGDHACHLLPLLDFKRIAAHPKIFMGFSDTTVLNVAIWQAAGLVTFNGPALLTDFAEYPTMFDYTRRWCFDLIGRDAPLGPISPAEYWTEEFLDWEEKKDQERPRALNRSLGWTWLKPGRMEGVLIGGCLESLEHLRGTRFWPDWQDALFFFETSEEKPSPARVDSILMDYENMGVLAKLKGMLVGRPMSYTDAEKQQLREVILARTAHYDFPVITDMDFGHTAPQFTLPVGCRARIDSREKKFEIIESAVRG